jgi:hypothetical protein
VAAATAATLCDGRRIQFPTLGFYVVVLRSRFRTEKRQSEEMKEKASGNHSARRRSQNGWPAIAIFH